MRSIGKLSSSNAAKGLEDRVSGSRMESFAEGANIPCPIPPQEVAVEHVGLMFSGVLGMRSIRQPSTSNVMEGLKGRVSGNLTGIPFSGNPAVDVKFPVLQTMFTVSWDLSGGTD